MTPEKLKFVVEDAPAALAGGIEMRYRLRIAGFPLRWKARITAWDPPQFFTDEQVSGPYKRWKHRHRFIAERGGARVDDVVDYEIPFGLLGRLANGLFVKRDLRGIFRFRSRRLPELLKRIAPLPSRSHEG